MRITSLKIFALLISCLVFFASHSRADAYTEAVNMVTELYKKYGHNVSDRSMECIYFNADGISPEGGIAVSARELRSIKCGGDPNTTRMVASFVVKDGVVYVEDLDFGMLTRFDENYKKPPVKPL